MQLNFPTLYMQSGNLAEEQKNIESKHRASTLHLDTHSQNRLSFLNNWDYYIWLTCPYFYLLLKIFCHAQDVPIILYFQIISLKKMLDYVTLKGTNCQIPIIYRFPTATSLWDVLQPSITPFNMIYWQCTASSVTRARWVRHQPQALTVRRNQNAPKNMYYRRSSSTQPPAQP